MFLVLNLKEKMGYFKKHWSADLQEDIAKCVEEVVWARFIFPVLLLI